MLVPILILVAVVIVVALILRPKGPRRDVALAAPLAAGPRRPRMTPVDGTILPAGVYPFDVSGWTQEATAGDASSDASTTEDADRAGDAGPDASGDSAAEASGDSSSTRD